MSIRYKILIPILGSLFIGLLLSGYVSWQSQNDHQMVEGVVNKAIRAKELQQKLSASFLESQNVIERVHSMTSLISPEEIKNSFNDAAGSLGQAIDELKKVALSSEMESVTEELSNQYNAWLADAFIVLGIRQASAIPTSEKMERYLRGLSNSIDKLSVLASKDSSRLITHIGNEKSASFKIQMILTLLIGLAGSIAAFFLARNLSRPLIELANAAEELASGDTTVDFSQQQRSDEIGTVAKAIAGFRDGVLQKARLEEEADVERSRREEKQRLIFSAIEAFNSRASSLLGSVEDRMSGLARSADDLANMSRESSGKAEGASIASDSANQNVQAVAAAAEQLSASISEISHQISNTSKLVSTATDNARSTNEKVAGLSDAANRIGEVVNLIQNIAEQTNLLALNATIEAARAGEAGKGFSVVAAEVKELADQTSKATEEIGGQIAEIQNSTQSAVEAIKSIVDAIEEVNGFTTEIAAAIEEQGASTTEISRNVAQASDEAMSVKGNVDSVGISIGETVNTVENVKAVSHDAANEMQQLKEAVESFLSEVKAA